MIGHLSRARRQPCDQVHLRSQLDRVAWLGSRRANPQLARGQDINVHEDVERGRDLIRLDAEGGQALAEVAEATGMLALVLVEDGERLGAARCQEEVMPPDVVGENREHWPT